MHYSAGPSGVGSNSLSAFTHGRGSVLALATASSGIPEVVVKSWYIPYIFFKSSFCSLVSSVTPGFTLPSAW